MADADAEQSAEQRAAAQAAPDPGDAKAPDPGQTG